MTTFTSSTEDLGVHSTDGLWERRLPLALLAYFCLHLVLRLIISDTLTLDEAEQVLLSQSLQWGYSGQPPFYAWLQQAVFFVFGRNLFSLALLKNGLLFLAYFFFLLSARELWPGRPELRLLAVLSWFFVPQIAWEAQRDLSHSVLVLTVASASLFLVVRALGRGKAHGTPGSGWYLAYGLAMALGLLSKYNFVVFAGALNLSLLILPEGRALLLNRRVFLSLTLVVLLSSPHFLWVASHWDTASRSLQKVEAGLTNNRFLGLGVFLLAGVSFLTPLWVVWIGFFPRLFRESQAGTSSPMARLIPIYLTVLMMGSAGGVLLLGVEHVKERWMIPLLFLAPLYFFSRTGNGDVDSTRVRRYRRLASGVALVILFAAGTRALLGPTLGVTTRVNYPFNQVASAIVELDPAPSSRLIVTHNSWFAGNLLQRIPESRVLVPGFPIPPLPEVSSVYLVWDAAKGEGLPEEIAAEVRSRFGMDPGTMVPEVITPPYKFGAGRQARVAFMKLERAETHPPIGAGSGRPH